MRRTLLLALASLPVLAADAAGTVPCRDWSTPWVAVDVPLGVDDFLPVHDVLYVAQPVAGEEILVVNIADATSPSAVGSTNVGSTVFGLAAGDGWLFAATNTGIVVLDLSNPSAPAVSASIPSSSLDVAVDGTRLYSVRTDALDVFDITVPTAAVLLGSTPAPVSPPIDPPWHWALFEVRAAAPNHVIVQATNYDDFYGDGSLALLSRVDVTDPNDAQFGVGTLGMAGAGQCSGPGGWWDSDGTFVVTGYTNQSCAPSYHASFACKNLADTAPRGVASVPADSFSRGVVMLTATTALWSMFETWTDTGFHLVDLSNPESPVLGPFLPHPTTYSEMVLVKDEYVYVDAGAELEVYEYANGAVESVFPPAPPDPFGAYMPGSPATDLTTSGTTLWLVRRNGIVPVVETVDIDDPAAPAAVGTLNLPTGTPSVVVATSYGALIGISSQVHSIDGSTPGAPALLGSYVHGTQVRDILVEGNLAHCAADDGYFRLDLADPATPTLDDSEALSSTAWGVAVWDGYAYLVRSGSPDGFLDMVQLGNNAALKHTVTVPGSPAAIAVRDGIAYLATTDGMSLYALPPDDSGPEPPPTLLGSVALPDAGVGVAVRSDFAYVVSVQRTFAVDVTDPASPTYVGSWNEDGANVAVGPQGELWIGSDRVASVEPQCGSSAVAAVVTAPAHAGLQVAPNPTPAATVISFALNGAGHVRLRILDVAGRRVADVTDGTLPAGPHRMTWSAPPGLPSGVYFARLETEEEVRTARVVLRR